MPGKLKILFLGDIIGRPGRNAMRKLLPGLVRKYSPVFIIANGENAAGGVGITQKIGEELFGYVDVLTSGNHIWDKKEALDYIDKNRDCCVLQIIPILVREEAPISSLMTAVLE